MVFSPGLTRFSRSLGEATIAGGIPDTFSVFLLDTTLAPFATSDPAGALILIDLSPRVTLQVFTSAFATATVSVVPEPTAVALLLAGLVAIGCRQKILNTSHR